MKDCSWHEAWPTTKSSQNNLKLQPRPPNIPTTARQQHAQGADLSDHLGWSRWCIHETWHSYKYFSDFQSTSITYWNPVQPNQRSQPKDKATCCSCLELYLSLIQVLTSTIGNGGKGVRRPQDGPGGILPMPSNVERAIQWMTTLGDWWPEAAMAGHGAATQRNPTGSLATTRR